MNKKAVIYARVSTDEQAEHGYSLQSQLEACRVYAENNGYEVVDEISDDYTGTELDRPGLTIVRQMIHHREVDAVVVYSPDRWTRNLAHMLFMREKLLEAGVDLLYCNRGKVDDTPEGRMMDNIEGVFAEYWREKIIENCKRGKDTKARNGRMILLGNPPFGYRKKGKGKDGELIRHEPELQVVCQIFEWYTVGNGADGPLSLRAIAKKLNEKGIASPTKGKKWDNGKIHRVLANEIYAGRTYYGKSRIIQKKRVRQPKETWIPIDVPHLAIVDQETYQATRVRAERNRQLSKRNKKRKYLLSGHFRCGTCGQIMVGYYRQGQLRYQCTTRWARPTGPQKCSTSNRSVATYKVDEVVWNFLLWILRDDRIIDEGLEKMAASREARLFDKRERLETIEELIERTERKIDRLMDELEEGGYEDEFLIATFRSKLDDVSTEKRSLEIERSNLEYEIAETEVPPTLGDELKAIADQYRENLPGASYKIKRLLLDKLNVKVGFYWKSHRNRWLEASCEFTDRPIKLRVSRIAPSHFFH